MKVDVNPSAIVKDVDLLATAKLIVDKYRYELDEPRLRSMLPAPMYIQQVKKTMQFFEKSKPHLKQMYEAEKAIGKSSTGGKTRQ
jgi:hypothetical protein